jgi:F-type H+-transporting ATPase subunit a
MSLLKRLSFFSLLLLPAFAMAAEEMPESAIAHGSMWQPAITGWITLGILFILALFGLTRLKPVPGGLQNAWEFAYEWLEEITVQVIGPKGPDLMWYFFSVFMFILIANLLGLVPYMASPTAKTDTTLALALCTFGVTHVLGMKKKGVFGYWGHFFHVVDASKESGVGKVITALLQFILLPAIELVGELARPLSLTMRLFGNIFAKEMLLAILAFLIFDYFSKGGAGNYALMTMPLLLRPAVLILGVLVSIIQATVFTALSMIYIGGAIATHDAHDEEHHTDAHGAPSAH